MCRVIFTEFVFAFFSLTVGDVEDKKLISGSPNKSRAGGLEFDMFYVFLKCQDGVGF